MKEYLLEKLKTLNLKEKNDLFVRYFEFNRYNHENNFTPFEINKHLFRIPPFELVQVFIDSGIDINAKNEAGYTLLFFAKSPKVAELLIQAGADVNTKNKYGTTPLFSAKSKEITELLIQAGADVNAQNNYRNTPLFFAKSKEIAEILIQAGADVNTRDKNGNTPLHWCNNQEIMELLIQAGADINIKNKNKETPSEYHRKNGHSDLADFMEQKAIEFERKKLNQVLPQSQKNSNYSKYRL